MNVYGVTAHCTSMDICFHYYCVYTHNTHKLTHMYLREILNQIIPVASLSFTSSPWFSPLTFLWLVLSSLSQRSLISVFSKRIFSSFLFLIHSFTHSAFPIRLQLLMGKGHKGDLINIEVVKYLILGDEGWINLWKMVYQQVCPFAHTIKSEKLRILFPLSHTVWLADLSSPTKDRSHAPCSGNAES